MQTRAAEIIKNILLALLAVTAVWLAVLAYSGYNGQESEQRGVRTRFSELLGQTRYHVVFQDQSNAGPVAARPVRISVNTAFGRMSVQRNAEALDEAYERFGGLLGEAMERAEVQSEHISAQTLFETLGRPGVYYAYDGTFQLPLLARWLGVSTSLTFSAQSMAVARESDGFYLLLVTPNGAERVRTEVDENAFRTLLGQSRPDGSAFAFERTEASVGRLDPLSLLSLGTVAMPTADAENPAAGKEYTTALVEQMGFNPYVGSYTTADGRTAYEEGTSTLYLDDRGSLVLQSTSSGSLRAESGELWAQVEYARNLLERITETGDARLYLTGAETKGDETVLTFDYYLSGARIRLSAGAAAVIRFSGSTVQRMELTLRSYWLNDGTEALLPEIQAAAIERMGANLTVCYVDAGGDSLSLGWDLN